MTNKTIKFLIDEDDLGKRLDVVLSEKINYLTRSYIKKIIESGNVKINQKIATFPSKKLKRNDSILIELVENRNNEIKPSS